MEIWLLVWSEDIVKRMAGGFGRFYSPQTMTKVCIAGACRISALPCINGDYLVMEQYLISYHIMVKLATRIVASSTCQIPT